MTPKEVSVIVNLGNQNKETQMSHEGLYKKQLIFWIPFLNSAHQKLIVSRNITILVRISIILRTKQYLNVFFSA